MSQGAGSSRKEKKAQRDAERRNKGQKRKLADTSEVEDPVVEETNATDTGDAQVTTQNGSDGVIDGNHDETEVSSKAKKRRKVANAAAGTEDGSVQESSTKSRFILFIGNLPYSTTDASLQAHFQKLSPFTLRHRTDPKTKKSKGFAFLEFENYDRMKTCLKLYHHSMFDPEAKENGGSSKGNGRGGRRINVELTAGGGGKAENRKEKIKVKNVRLEEQRKRRAEAERKEKVRKERKEGSKGDAQQDDMQADEAPAEEDNDGIHPSRRARMDV